MFFDFTFILFSDPSSILEVLMAGFFLGILSIFRFFLFLLITLFKMQLFSVLKEFERISKIKLKMPIIYFFPKIQKYWEIFDTILLPLAFLINGILSTGKENLRYYKWKYSKINQNVAFSMLPGLKQISYNFGSLGKKKAPEYLDGQGKSLNLIDSRYADSIKEFRPTGSLNPIGKHIENNPESINIPIAGAITGNIYKKQKIKT